MGRTYGGGGWNMTAKRIESHSVIRGIRYGILLLLILYIGLLFASEGDSSTPFEAVEKAVVEASGDNEMTKAEARELKRLYGMNEKDFEGVSLYYTQATMGVEELLLIRTLEGQDTAAVVESIQKRREIQLDNFEGYGAEQVKLLNDSVIKTKGNYVLFVVSPKAEAVEKAFTKSL